MIMRTSAVLLAAAALFSPVVGEESIYHGIEQSQQHRELSFGWSNLLFHIGVCSISQSCPTSSSGGPLCPCPDCNRPHPPFGPVADYCNGLHSSSSSYSGSSSSSSGSTSKSSYSYEATYNNTNSSVLQTYADTYPSGSGSNNQNASWKFSAAMYVAGAACILGVGTAIAMKHRQNATQQSLALNLGDEADDEMIPTTTSAHKVGGVFGAIGALVAGAGAAAAVAAGRGKPVAGSVARRMGALEAGDDEASPYHAETDEPAFVQVPDATRTPEMINESSQGIEIEGPYRPSSNFSSSSRYAV